MIFLYIVIFINCFFFAINLYRYKDLTSPPVLFYFFWILSLLGVAPTTVIDDLQLSTATIFALGAVAFHIGFNVSFIVAREDADSCIARPDYMKYVALIISIIFCYSMYDLLMHGSGDTLYRILTNKENEDLNLSGHLKKIIQTTSLIFFVIYLKNPFAIIRKQIKWYTILVLIMGLLCALSIPSRNAMLQFFLPLIVIVLSVLKWSNKRKLLVLLVSFSLFMGYYSFISANKYFYRYEKSNSATDVLSSEVNVYLSGSIIAFDLAKDENAFSRKGKNTFRFFYAVYDKLNGSNNAEKLTNEFYQTNGLRTNVFTFYDFYARDFGYVYALLIQFLLSLLYGFVYKKRNTSQGLFWHAILSYPLVMQFFQDQYISLTSTWLQIGIISFVIFNTKIFQTKITNRSIQEN